MGAMRSPSTTNAAYRVAAAGTITSVITNARQIQFAWGYFESTGVGVCGSKGG